MNADLDPDTRTAAILEERARIVARPSAGDTPPQTLDAICFNLGAELYAIDAAFVQRIAHSPPLTRLPGTPPYFAGLANVRGFLITIVELAHLLGIAPDGDSSHLIVLGRDRFDIGFLATAVTHIVALPADIASAPRESGPGGSLVRYVLADGRALIDGGTLLDDPRLVVGNARAVSSSRSQ